MKTLLAILLLVIAGFCFDININSNLTFNVNLTADVNIDIELDVCLKVILLVSISFKLHLLSKLKRSVTDLFAFLRN